MTTFSGLPPTSAMRFGTWQQKAAQQNLPRIDTHPNPSSKPKKDEVIIRSQTSAILHQPSKGHQKTFEELQQEEAELEAGLARVQQQFHPRKIEDALKEAMEDELSRVPLDKTSSKPVNDISSGYGIIEMTRASFRASDHKGRLEVDSKSPSIISSEDEEEAHAPTDSKLANSSHSLPSKKNHRK